MSCLQLGVRHTAVKSGGAPPEADCHVVVLTICATCIFDLSLKPWKDLSWSIFGIVGMILDDGSMMPGSGSTQQSLQGAFAICSREQ